MSAPFVPALDTFEGGQMTDLPVFNLTLTGTELFEIVASGTSQPTTSANAVNYSITSALLGQLLAPLVIGLQHVITQGQNNTALTAYVIPANVTRVYVDKVTPEPTYVTFGSANTQLADVLVKDVAGTADAAANGIFTTVTADGFANPTITVPYGGFFFRPVTSLNIWTLGTS
jgi:hypothetical protein